MNRAPVTLSPEEWQVMEALWEGPMVGYENTLMVHIRRLREKLETDPSHPQYLLTVRGLGYRLAQEERP